MTLGDQPPRIYRTTFKRVNRCLVFPRKSGRGERRDLVGLLIRQGDSTHPIKEFPTEGPELSRCRINNAGADVRALEREIGEAVSALNGIKLRPVWDEPAGRFL